MTYEEAVEKYSAMVAEYNEAVNRLRQYGIHYQPITSWTLEPWGSGWDIVYEPLGYRQSMEDFAIAISSMEGARTGLESEFPSPENLAAHMADLGATLVPLPVYTDTPEFVPSAVEFVEQTSGQAGVESVPQTTPQAGDTSSGEVPYQDFGGGGPSEVPGWFKALPWVIGLLALRGILR